MLWLDGLICRGRRGKKKWGDDYRRPWLGVYKEARGRALVGQKRKKIPTYFSAPKWPELGGKHKLLMNFTVLPQMPLPKN